MNPITTELQLDEQQRQDDQLRKAGEIDMDEYVQRLRDRKVERWLARANLVIFMRQEKDPTQLAMSLFQKGGIEPPSVYHTPFSFSTLKFP